MVFGTDFDNTIVSYEPLFREAAEELGVDVPPELTVKRELRDYLRALPDGERIWQKIQAVVYGKMMPKATLLDGFCALVKSCRQRSIPVFVVSHKTQFAAQDSEVNLRTAAINWMDAHGFFAVAGLGLSQGQVFFEDTRRAKIDRIRELGCSHFVDDMVEVLADENFPHGVKKILFAPQGGAEKTGEVIRVYSWPEIQDELFGTGASG